MYFNQDLRKLIFFAFLLFLFSLMSSENIFAYPAIYPTGTTIYEPGKVFEGYTLYHPEATFKILLIDMNGDIVHTWESPDYNLYYAEPLPNGNVLVKCTKLEDGSQGIIELDWNSNVVWEYFNKSHPSPHHDHERLENGNTLILFTRLKFAPKISPIPIKDDYILEVDPKGKIVWSWYTYKHYYELGLSKEERRLISQVGGDWAHTNTISTLPENSLGDDRFAKGNILVSQRNTNRIFIIDKKSGSIVWKVANLTIGQHNPTMIPQGFTGAENILVFDNGGSFGYPERGRYFSRVIEIDPLTQNIVWEYNAAKSGMGQITFFSPTISGMQRLENGNTLIDEGRNGRFFEVTHDGEIVWEYINPYFDSSPLLKDNRVYRIWRVDLSWVP